MDHQHHHQDHGQPKMDNMDHMDHMDHMDNMDHSETMDQMEPSHTMAHSMGHMMMMYFHGGYDEVILFDFWRVSTIGGLVGSMIGCFLMGVLYEGIKSYREHWMNGAFHAVSYNQVRLLTNIILLQICYLRAIE